MDVIQIKARVKYIQRMWHRYLHLVHIRVFKVYVGEADRDDNVFPRHSEDLPDAHTLPHHALSSSRRLTGHTHAPATTILSIYSPALSLTNNQPNLPFLFRISPLLSHNDKSFPKSNIKTHFIGKV